MICLSDDTLKAWADDWSGPGIRDLVIYHGADVAVAAEVAFSLDMENYSLDGDRDIDLYCGTVDADTFFRANRIYRERFRDVLSG